MSVVPIKPSQAEYSDQLTEESMSISTKDYIESKLETIEARMDGRIAAMQEINKSTNDKIDALSSNITQLKYVTVTTGIAAVLGIAAFNATVLSNMVASFESGKNTAQAISNASSELKATQSDIKLLRDEIKKQTKK